MRNLVIDNYIIKEPIENILKDLQRVLTNGKLKDIRIGSDNIVCTCPVHKSGNEANPDLNIYIGDNPNIPFGFARCFACDFKGSFVVFISKCFESSVEFAKTWLIERYGELADTVNVSLDSPISLTKKTNNYLDESILDSYQKWTPYLSKRKLNRDICDKFKVRYDSYNRQVIFPVYDINNNLKMLARRSIDTKYFYMDKNQDKEVYALNIIQKNNVKSCLLVEGPIDCLTCWSHGIPAIAMLGTPSDYQIENINKSCLTSIYIATDNDDAGKKFANDLDKKLNKRILRTRVDLPKTVKDVNDLSDEEWNNLIFKYNLTKY